MTDDLISRQAAIDAIYDWWETPGDNRHPVNVIKKLPSAQPERRYDEWCTDCKEYDQEKHCCPRFNHVIRTTLQDVQEERKKGQWIYYPEINALSCSECKRYVYHYEPYNYCPNCGSYNGGENEE